MSEIIKKKFREWEFEEEEKWINEKIQEGLLLKKVQGNNYIFEKCEPKEYQIKLEVINVNFWNRENQKYIKSIREKGGELIESNGRFFTTCRMYIKNKIGVEDIKLYYNSEFKIKQRNITLFTQFVTILIWFSIGMNLDIFVDFNENPKQVGNIIFLVLYIGMVVYLATDVIKVMIVKNKFKKM